MDPARHRDFLGVGWSFPVALDPIGGDIALAAYARDVKEAIRIIIRTSPGERVMRPNFGCGIRDLVFEEISAATMVTAEARIRDALTVYEPRIQLLGVIVDPFQALNGMLLITVDYRVRRTNQTDNLVYPYYFKEGGAR
jgi:phage baseplate assembly protein W